MVPSRLPRFQRADVAPISVTERDRKIIEYVHRHRFLRSSQIVAQAKGSAQQVLRRLQALYHRHYLERPRCQLDYYHAGGSREIVYGLGDQGARLLQQEGIPVFPSRWSEKNRSVGRIQLEHSLMVAEVMVAIETDAPKNGVSLKWGDELNGNGRQAPSRWNLDVGGGRNVGVVPDRIFALESADKRESSLYFLEADRGTMPVVRKDLTLTSMFRKFLAYESTWSQGIHRSHFGFNRMRVLIVTSSGQRLEALLNACRKLHSGRGIFLMTDRSLISSEGPYSKFWTTHSGERERLFH
jgi:hypothetical protein